MSEEQVAEIVKRFNNGNREGMAVYEPPVIKMIHSVAWTNGWICICTCGEYLEDSEATKSQVMKMFAAHLKEMNR